MSSKHQETSWACSERLTYVQFTFCTQGVCGIAKWCEKTSRGEAYSKPCQTYKMELCENSERLQVVDCFCNKLHLKYLMGSRIRLSQFSKRFFWRELKIIVFGDTVPQQTFFDHLLPCMLCLLKPRPRIIYISNIKSIRRNIGFIFCCT